MKDKPTWITYINNTAAFFILYLFKIFLKPKKNGTNLLLVNTGQIGDLIISSILFENADTLSKKYDNIYFLLRYEYEELFKNIKKINFINWNYQKYKYNIFYRINFLLKLRKMNIIDTFNLTAARGITVDELSLLSGAKNTYALNSNYRYLTKLFGNKIDKMYTKLFANSILNEYDKNLEVLKFLGIDDHFDKTSFEKTITNNNYKYEIAIAPFSSLNNRDWGAEMFNEVISQISNKYKVLLLGSLNQKKQLELLKNKNVTINAGGLSLDQLYDQINNVKLFIGLDSGLSHIALNVGTPLIAIIGGGNFGRFFPYNESSKARYLYHNMDCFGCEWRCIHDKPYCLTEVTVDEVMKNVNEILNNYENS